MFKNQFHQFQFDAGATLASLMSEIASKLNVPVESQKIICKGKSLTAPMEPLVDGMKLLLMATSAPPVMNTNPPPANTRKYSLFVPTIIDTLKEPYHQEIIKLGPPEGYIKPNKFQTTVLPQQLMYVREGTGKRSILSFESDALFLQNDDGTVERIFFTEIVKTAVLTIPDSDGNFVALGMITKSGNKWIYFIASQYTNLIKSLFHS